MSVIDLDRRGQYGDVDRADVIERILGMPGQLRDAWAMATGLSLPPGHREASQIVICGMGGSAIGGDFTRSLVKREARVPLAVVRSYDLPGYVGPTTLVIASSFSGATEEVLSATDAALGAGARVIAVTTGGPLADRARTAGFPLVQFSFPGQPREAIGFSTLLMLGVLSGLGYVADRTSEVAATAALLEEMSRELGPEAPTEANSAKRLAQRLYRRVGVIYGGGLMAEVARRWKGQLNENAKTWAFFEQLPELNHNAVLGYQFPTDVAARILVVMLSSSVGHPRIALRERVTAELLGRWGVETEWIRARGASALEQVFSATYFGDFASYYLSLINDVDPSDIAVISFLKARLAQEPSAVGPLSS